MTVALVRWIGDVATYWSSDLCDCSGCAHYSEGHDGHDDVDRCAVLHAPRIPTSSGCQGVAGIPPRDLDGYPRAALVDE